MRKSQYNTFFTSNDEKKLNDAVNKIIQNNGYSPNSAAANAITHSISESVIGFDFTDLDDFFAHNNPIYLGEYDMENILQSKVQLNEYENFLCVFQGFGTELNLTDVSSFIDTVDLIVSPDKSVIYSCPYWKSSKQLTLHIFAKKKAQNQ